MTAVATIAQDQDPAEAYGPLPCSDGDGYARNADGKLIVGVKECVVCGLVKPVGYFYLDKRKRADGTVLYNTRAKCRACWDYAQVPEAIKIRREQVAQLTKDWQYMYRTRAGQLFDIAFAQRLHDIAEKLDHYDIRHSDVPESYPKSYLSSVEASFIHHALEHNDTDVLYFLFRHDIYTPIGQAVSLDGMTVIAPPGVYPQERRVPRYDDPAPVAPDYIPPTESALPPLPTPSTISDGELEDAAETLVSIRARKQQLTATIKDAEARLQNLRKQLDETERDRQAAIQLLRKA